jgi:hypothetical protein
MGIAVFKTPRPYEANEANLDSFLSAAVFLFSELEAPQKASGVNPAAGVAGS